jgi:hypothetical protein
MFQKYLMKPTLYLLISIVIGCFLYPYMTDANIKEIVSTQLNMTASIFAISGLWISQIYPDAIKAYGGNVSILIGSQRAKRIESLVLVVATSALILVLMLLYNFISPVLSEVVRGTQFQQKFEMGKVTFLVLVALTLIRSIGSIMFYTFQFSDELHQKNEELEAQKRLD